MSVEGAGLPSAADDSIRLTTVPASWVPVPGTCRNTGGLPGSWETSQLPRLVPAWLCSLPPRSPKKAQVTTRPALLVMDARRAAVSPQVAAP